jgi:glycosyltransferase involved in cell wall biosynthesis
MMTEPSNVSQTPPTVSVALAVYNSDRYLRACLDSILSQTWTDFEFLIIDDGSTDNSLKILEAYAAQDQRIQLTSRPNRGIAKTRNELLAQAKGEFIAVMDGDDIALADRFARQVAFLQNHPEVVCVGSAMNWIDEQGRYLGHCAVPEQDEEIQALLLGGISLLHHPCTMVRRSAMLQVGGYDESMIASVDLDLWLRLGEVGRLANLPDTLFHYRLHSGSITNARQKRQTDDALHACQRAWQRRGIQGRFLRKPADHLYQTQFWIRCGWLGFMDRQRAVARRCGLRAITLQPFCWEAWKLLACAIAKPLPHPT